MARTILFDSLPWPPDENAFGRLAAFLDSVVVENEPFAIACIHRSMVEHGIRIGIRDVDLDDRPPFISDGLAFIEMNPAQWALMYVYRALRNIPRMRDGHLMFDWSAIGAIGNAGDGVLTVTILSTPETERTATA